MYLLFQFRCCFFFFFNSLLGVVCLTMLFLKYASCCQQGESFHISLSFWENNFLIEPNLNTKTSKNFPMCTTFKFYDHSLVAKIKQHTSCCSNLVLCYFVSLPFISFHCTFPFISGSHFDGHQNYLKDMLRPRQLDPTPTGYDSVNVGEGLRICISNELPGDANTIEYIWSGTLNKLEGADTVIEVLLYISMLTSVLFVPENPGNFVSYVVWEEMAILVIWN